MNAAIVTDSTSDLDPATAARCGIDVVPLFVQFGDERFRDTVDLTRKAFYRRFRASPVLPATSQPTAAVVEAGPVIATHAGPEAVGVFVLPG